MQAFNPPKTRLARNVHLFSANSQRLGGLYLNTPPQITNAYFYKICTHFIRLPSQQTNPDPDPTGNGNGNVRPWFIHAISDAPSPNNTPAFSPTPLPRSSSPLQKG
ncbi:hypothetical protein BDV19DRAFT_383699 [Aspergillus venezuelensis]